MTKTPICSPLNAPCSFANSSLALCLQGNLRSWGNELDQTSCWKRVAGVWWPDTCGCGVAGEKCHCRFASAEVSVNGTVALTSSSFTLLKDVRRLKLRHVEQEYFETFFCINYSGLLLMQLIGNAKVCWARCRAVINWAETEVVVVRTERYGSEFLDVWFLYAFDQSVDDLLAKRSYVFAEGFRLFVPSLNST